MVNLQITQYIQERGIIYMKELMEEMNLEEMENENGGYDYNAAQCAYFLYSCVNPPIGGYGGCGGSYACDLYRMYC